MVRTSVVGLATVCKTIGFAKLYAHSIPIPRAPSDVYRDVTMVRKQCHVERLYVDDHPQAVGVV